MVEGSTLYISLAGAIPLGLGTTTALLARELLDLEFMGSTAGGLSYLVPDAGEGPILAPFSAERPPLCVPSRFWHARPLPMPPCTPMSA